MKILNWAALIVLIIGGLNWGLVGIARFDLIFLILGPMTAATRTVYLLVGISAVYIAVISKKLIKG